MLRSRIPVAVLGATGVVGQRLVSLLDGHPWFEPVTLAASERTAGRRYHEACAWRLESPLPEWAAGMVVRPADDLSEAVIVFSALDAAVASAIERRAAHAGRFVVSNARCHRMDVDVPLLVPEINPGHLALLERQRRARGWPGAIVTNPNCATATLALALAPLARAFGLKSVVVTTMQAVSGAGHPGVPSLDVLGNVIPWIAGEEEKIEAETARILGSADVPHAAVVSATATRVPVLDGHTMVVTAALASWPDPEAVRDALSAFRGVPQERGLPSAPAAPVLVRCEPDRPQPRLDLRSGGGMSTVVGRLRSLPGGAVRFVALGHNTIRGAAGAALLNAELLVSEGLVA